AGEAIGDDIATSPETTQAIDRALAWLADQQNDDGSWTGSVGFKLNQSYEVERTGVPHVGVTALAGMAFLAGGHLPDRGRYGRTISRATDFVLSCVDPTSGFISHQGTRMYSHAFATLYLAEVIGMTRRADLRDKLQRSVDLIVQSQNEFGSWRYEPFAVESDMSITVCQLMALRAARNIGMKVPKATIDRAVEYVTRSYIPHDEPPRFWFNDEYYFLRKGG
ncbi:MAG: terpene cyclase/mutase family protein, partial [Planctomycetes bacterium]|nr:terpene cyclase/mutase family protein [Planctomycetota bacterium]